MDTVETHPFRKRVWLVAAAATIMLLAITCSIYLLQPYFRAHYVFGQLGGLHVGQSGFIDAQRVARRIGAVPSEPCSSTDCYWRVWVDNSRLPEQWRGIGANLGVGFQVSNSVVTEKGFTLQIGARGDGPFVQVHEQGLMRGMPAKPVYVETQSSAQLPHYHAFVSLMPDAPVNVREQYFAANLDCFWKYRGCQDAQELLQVIEWK